MVFISFLFDRSQMLMTLSRPELELLCDIGEIIVIVKIVNYSDDGQDGNYGNVMVMVRLVTMMM